MALFSPAPARADVAPASVSAGAIEQGLLCRSAVRQAEAGADLPPHMLGGIALVESGRRDPATGRENPWPWSINSEGRDHIFATKTEAVAYARDLRARGVRSFDVGCLQVNLMYHPDAFASLDEAFDPVANARYAAKFLGELRDRTGSWETASAWYHSANPEEGLPYRGKVVAAMEREARDAGAFASLPNPAPPAAPFLAPGFRAPNLAAPNFAASGFMAGSMPARMGATMRFYGGAGGAILPPPSASAAAGLVPAPGAVNLASAAPGAVNLVSAAPGAGANPGAGGEIGRGLDAYRMRPVRLASR